MGEHREIRDKLLRSIDHRDPWSAADLIDWLRGHFPEYIEKSFEEKQAAVQIALSTAAEVADDAAFPAIVANLRKIAVELDERPILDQIADIVQAVNAHRDALEDVKLRSTHIIATGGASGNLMKALAELNGSLTYTISIADFIENEAKLTGQEPQP